MASALSCGTLPETPRSISDCNPNTPTTGEVRLEPWCSDLEIVAGEGRSRDWWLGNTQINMVIRYPTVSVTAAGIGGGSLADLSLIGENDLVHEITPLFGGGWLNIESVSELDNGISFEGVISNRPGQQAAHEGEYRTLTWRLDPDQHSVQIDGPDQLIIHPRGASHLSDQTLYYNNLALSHNGFVSEDLGGSYIVDGASTLSVQSKVSPKIIDTLPAQVLPDLENYIVASFDWPIDSSKRWRVEDGTSLSVAAESNISFIVGTAEDDITPLGHSEHVWFRPGCLSTHPDGYNLVSWPWTSSTKKAGHGAPDISYRTPEDALYTVWGAEGKDRYVMVDLQWLSLVGHPSTLDHHPEMVELTSPGPDGPTSGTWRHWFSWLDAKIPLAPTGPITLVEVIDKNKFSSVDVERGLLEGKTIATTGPTLTLQTEETEDRVVVSIGHFSAPMGVTVALITDGGQILASRTHNAIPFELSGRLTSDVSWVVGAIWSDDGLEWAVTGPLRVD